MTAGYRAIAALAFLAALAAGIGFWHHRTYEAGRQSAFAEVALATAKIEAERKGRAAAAETARDQELTALRAYRDAHPERPVRLCLGSARVPATPADQRQPGAPAGDVLPLPAGDHRSGPRGEGPDIGGLLELLAARGDQVSADLRKRQAIQP